MLIPFFEGERTPNVPDGTGVYFGVRDQTFDADTSRGRRWKGRR